MRLFNRDKIGKYFLERLKNLVLPGFDRVPMYDVIVFFVRGFRKGALVTRASSIAFNLLLSLVPASFLLFTLIPYIPVQGFQEQVISLFESITPERANVFMEQSIREAITTRSNIFLIIMIVASAIMSTNGIHALINAFVVSDHKFETRSWTAQRKIAFFLFFIIGLLITVSAILLIFGRVAVERLVDGNIIESNIVFYMLQFIKWLVIIGLLFTAISFLYYLAPSRKAKFRFISAGSSLATLLFIATSLGFSAYVNNFDQYNRLYGSMGTILVILLWLYLNSITLLIGFELNASIKSANINNANGDGQLQ
ncbi:MAG: YihY/virulence factor BrkB family protein [Bacteroidales bacterium]|jgi:membrane protein|nr:YihY/virulence factor BrkB family protein [Bacteroidales bacterium]